MKNDILIATHNIGKFKEIKYILRDYFNNIYSLKDFNIDTDVEETGKTFYENALLKAKAISERVKIPVLSDDSGLCVEALNNEPGIYSARYAKEHDDKANIKKLLKKLNNKKDRDAYFICCVVVLFPDGKIISATGITKGEILSKEQGNNGFGYDPVFYSYELQKSFGIATEEEKNKISHRSKAIRNLLAEYEKDFYNV